MYDINLRGQLCENDDADILRWWGWRDIVAPMDIADELKKADGDDVTILVNSSGGSMVVGGEIRSMLRRYPGKTVALFQGYGASAATLAVSACDEIQSEPGALLCYHNPSAGAEGDFHDMEHSAEMLKNARDAILEQYCARAGVKSREELIELMDKNTWITPTMAKEYGLIDSIVGLSSDEDASPDPRALTASAFGGGAKVTAAMREKYLASKVAERDEQAKCALAKMRALANY